MTREDRCTYIEKMTDSDRADFEKASDYVCALCAEMRSDISRYEQNRAEIEKRTEDLGVL